MTYQHIPKVLAVWAVLVLLIPVPQAFSQLGQHEPRDRARAERERIEQTEQSETTKRAEDVGRREAQLDLSAFTLPALPPLSLPINVPSPSLAADEFPFGPTSEADFPRVSVPPDAGCDEFLTTGELCA